MRPICKGFVDVHKLIVHARLLHACQDVQKVVLFGTAHIPPGPSPAAFAVSSVSDGKEE